MYLDYPDKYVHTNPTLDFCEHGFPMIHLNFFIYVEGIMGNAHEHSINTHM